MRLWLFVLALVHAETATFTCKISYVNAERQWSSETPLGSEAKFPGLGNHEEITLSNKASGEAISVNSYLDDPTQPYIVDSLSCDGHHKCRGGRTFFLNGSSSTKNFKVQDLHDSAQALLSEDVVVEYQPTAKGFAFRVPSYAMTNSKYGTHIQCLSE